MPLITYLEDEYGDRVMHLRDGEQIGARFGIVETGRTLIGQYGEKTEFRFVPDNLDDQPGPVRLGQLARAVEDARTYTGTLTTPTEESDFLTGVIACPISTDENCEACQ